jgi:predicted transcriptional regulator
MSSSTSYGAIQTTKLEIRRNILWLLSKEPVNNQKEVSKMQSMQLQFMLKLYFRKSVPKLLKIKAVRKWA